MDALSTKFTGQPLKRLEDPRLLRGQACFVDDLRLPDVRHVAFVRSMHPHARFRVDASAATAVSGVVAVFTAVDFQGTGGFREIPTVVPHPALRPCAQLPLAKDIGRSHRSRVSSRASVSTFRWWRTVGCARPSGRTR